jgi:hypothetical protein
MSRKPSIPALMFIGIALMMFAVSNAMAHGGGGGGGGHGGGFHGGGGSFHGATYHGGGYGISHGYAGHAVSIAASPRFASGPMTVNRFTSPGVVRISQTPWRHTQVWVNWGAGQVWYQGRNFDRYHPYYGGVYVGWPYFLPRWYNWYGWPYYRIYGYNYWPSYYYDSYDEPLGVSVSPPTQAAVTQDSPSTGDEYAEQARNAFRSGDYREALRLASHAAVEMPQNAAVHELMSLALFAQKDYRGAAAEAHIALANSPPIDWPTLLSYYGNVETYTQQLRALEAFTQENPKKPEGRFLLGYHYIMTGHKDAAKKELVAAKAIVPDDKLAESLVKQLDSK